MPIMLIMIMVLLLTIMTNKIIMIKTPIINLINPLGHLAERRLKCKEERVLIIGSCPVVVVTGL